MAQKATKQTSNGALVADILDDQAAMMLRHLAHETRIKRLEYNLKVLFGRLGEDLSDQPLYCL